MRISRFAQLILMSTTVIAVSVTFHRGIGDSFDLMKATLLWIGASLLLPFLLSERSTNPKPKIILFALSGLLIALSISTLVSVQPLQSLFGQYQRNTGSLTLFACAVLLLTAARQKSQEIIATAYVLVLSSILVAGYAFLQEVGWDPWEWETPGQARAVFGSLGNSNTSAGFVGCMIPVFVGAISVQISRVRRLAAGSAAVFVAGTVGILGAFQGVVAGLFGLFLMMAFCVNRRQSVLLSLYELGIIGLSSAGLFLVQSEIGLAALLLLSLAWAGLLRLNFDTEMKIMEVFRSSKRRSILTAVAACAATLIAGYLGMGEVSRQVSEGMRERKFFYGAAFELFFSKPVFGPGLETFGLYYTRFRAAEHATLYEGNRTSSAHSIPLGMFANGGLILGLTYLFFVGTIGYLIFKYRKELAHSAIYAGIASAWIATQVQSLVSVEHVALFMQQFILAGLVVAAGTCRQVNSRSRERLKSRRNFAKIDLFKLSGGIVVALFLIGPLTRPIRADSQGFWSLRYSANGELVASLDAANKARNLAPWSSQQMIRFAQASYENQTPNFADVVLDAAELVDFTPPYGLEAAYRVGEAGNFSLAMSMAETALLRDPESLGLKNAVSDLYIQVGEIQASQGLNDEAKSSFDRAIEVGPSESFRLAAKEAIEALSAGG